MIDNRPAIYDDCRDQELLLNRVHYLSNISNFDFNDHEILLDRLAEIKYIINCLECNSQNEGSII